MTMRTFAYDQPESLADVIAALGAAPSRDAVRPLAGGTDLLTLMKGDIVAPDRLLDLKRLTGLDDTVEIRDNELVLGALTTLTAIETGSLVGEHCPALAKAASLAATPQLRNRATLGGNLLQRPRCWYFREHLIPCWLKGGDACPAREGENGLHALFADSPCVAVHPSDLATVLLAMDATVTVRGDAGERAIAAGDFFVQPDEGRRRENTLGGDEVVLSVAIPLIPGRTSAYHKAMDRKAWAFALVSAACSFRLDGGVMRDVRVVLGGVAPIPWRSTAAEAALDGERPGADVFARAAAAALAGAEPLRHNGYKVPLARNLVIEALEEVTRA